MSIIENKHVPQKPKEFKKYPQDHGDAATQIPRFSEYTADWLNVGREKKDAERLAAALADIDYSSMTSAELDREASRLLGEGSELAYSSHDDIELAPDAPIDIANDRFPSEAEMGVKSKREITGEMARRATLDPSEDDDLGDSDFDSPIRIKNRL